MVLSEDKANTASVPPIPPDESETAPQEERYPGIYQSLHKKYTTLTTNNSKMVPLYFLQRAYLGCMQLPRTWHLGGNELFGWRRGRKTISCERCQLAYILPYGSLVLFWKRRGKVHWH
jgi:hypothetical protein